MLSLLSLTLLTALGGVDLAWDTASLKLDDTGRLVSLTDRATGTDHAVPGGAFCRLEVGREVLEPTRVTQAGDRVTFEFAGGIKLTYQVTLGAGFTVWNVVGLAGLEPDQITTLRLVDLNLDRLPKLRSMLNAAAGESFTVATFGTTVNVLSQPIGGAQRGQNKEGVSHSFASVEDDLKQGLRAVDFTATSERDTGDGWAVRPRRFNPAHDLAGLVAVKAWVKGDGHGGALKIQLTDLAGGYRDDYITNDFVGWREVVCEKPSLDTLDLQNVRQVALYYNSLPPKTTVTCRIDAIRAVVETPAGQREIMLEDFEDPGSDWFDAKGVFLRAESYERHGVVPAGFGLVACPNAKLPEAVAAFEQAAGLPSPRFGGQWAKESDWSHRSYLFITGVSESDTDAVIEWAHRGGLPMVLIVGGSWSASHGHHEVNQRYFPDGLPSLQRTVDKLHAAGLKVGLHFLAPAVYPNDAYVTPKPDPRLFKDASNELAEAVDEQTKSLPLTAAPTDFPDEDGGYHGNGTYVQIDDELISYGQRSTAAPFALDRCVRGALGTTASAHAKGAKVLHLKRSYGYFLFDLDSTLAAEVTANVCRVANAVGADMLYFDGSERLQGDHWYYNGKLQSNYLAGLDNPNTFLQGSSYSQYSWHFISRTASADGHGDVKGYLDERTARFPWYFDNLMPLDIGWYYVHDRLVTVDQFDYILQRCLGFDSSISVQVSPARFKDHPEVGPIFDLVNLYERLRVSGLVPDDIKAKLREPKREYRTLLNPLRLRRTTFGEWQDATALAEGPQRYTVEPTMPGARLGLQLRCGALTRPGDAYNSPSAIVLDKFETLDPYLNDPDNRFASHVEGTGKIGATSEGVEQSFEASAEGHDGGPCVKYTATSTRGDDGGWSSLGRRFDPPLDLTKHAGIGLWLKGNGAGGKFKLQLREGSHATDYYVTNDFETWRYIQLVRPEQPQPHVVDYAKIDYLIWYFNGVPSNTTATCWIDDVKALPGLDAPHFANPTVKLGDRTVTIPASLSQGERLVWFPAEQPYVIPDGIGARRPVSLKAAPLELPAKAEVTLSAESSAATEVRWVQDLPEELKLPEAALKTKLEPLPDAG